MRRPGGTGPSGRRFCIGEVNVDEVQKEVRFLPVVLTDEERADRAMTLARTISDVNEREAEAKQVAKASKDEVDRLRREVNWLSSIVVSGTEGREVECHWARDDERSLMILIRVDTGEKVDSRAMTDRERQRGLFPRGEAATDFAS